MSNRSSSRLSGHVSSGKSSKTVYVAAEVAVGEKAECARDLDRIVEASSRKHWADRLSATPAMEPPANRPSIAANVTGW